MVNAAPFAVAEARVSFAHRQIFHPASYCLLLGKRSKLSSVEDCQWQPVCAVADAERSATAGTSTRRTSRCTGTGAICIAPSTATRALVDMMFSEHRDMAAAKAFFRAAKTVTGHYPGPGDHGWPRQLSACDLDDVG